ncbi:MAG: arsenic efflux protein [Clostridia bacterium]|nr:arsenic efflux protein [Clostridia bacterium]
MHEYWHVILEALIHTAQILPLLFIVYYIIELIEYKHAGRMQKSKLLKGKASPVVGSALGCIPQCGFSVVSTDLFSKGKLSIGALIAVYIATSDEAIPLMIANPKSIGWMALLVGIKIVFGILIGYLSILLFKAFFKDKKTQEHMHIHSDEEDNHEEKEEYHHEEHEEESVHGGCCHHNVETKSFDWVHPLTHCLKISLFILIINILFGFITHIWVGEDRLIAFLSQSKAVQPLLAILIGLIPNCASSVVLTELFLLNGLTFGALVAGLCVNAGLGLVVLLKQNKNWKVNIFICCMLIIPSLILGYALNWI